MSKVVLGFSGGVDSAVSAVLLQKAGYEVHGLYLDNTDEKTRLEAVEAAARMGIELTVLDVRQELDEKVCTPFCESYLRGETPNPCILCNPTVKFRALLAEADRIGAEQVATGHYARVENGALYKGRPANDQSYMLCRLRREQVARVVLPLGRYEKKEVRALAESFVLPAAHKPDSMEICFVPDKDYVNWIAQRRALPGPGDFVLHGEVVGRHEGIFRYTVGQRKSGLIDGRKVYVSRIDPVHNTVELALWEELFKREVGVSISEYVILKRLEAAKNMLRFSDYELSQISDILHFSSYSHFARTFRRYYDMSPGKYRDRYFRREMMNT